MKKPPSRGKKRIAKGLRPTWLAWYQAKKPLLVYAGTFAGLVLGFSLLALTPAYHALLEWEVAWTAQAAHGILFHLPGGDSIVSGAGLFRGYEAILEVKSQCSGFSFCWLFCAAVLAFPAGLGLRLAGALVGCAILLGLNILRIVCLFLVGSYYPGWFAGLHEQFWPTFSLLVTVGLMGGWLLCRQGLLWRASGPWSPSAPPEAGKPCRP